MNLHSLCLQAKDPSGLRERSIPCITEGERERPPRERSPYLGSRKPKTRDAHFDSLSPEVKACPLREVKCHRTASPYGKEASGMEGPGKEKCGGGTQVLK